jgi:hypothetical protein
VVSPFADFCVANVSETQSEIVFTKIYYDKIPQPGRYKADIVIPTPKKIETGAYRGADWTLGDTLFVPSDGTHVRFEGDEIVLSLTRLPAPMCVKDTEVNHEAGHIFTDPVYGYGSYRARISVSPVGGIVAGFFLYDARVRGGASVNDEIDVEIFPRYTSDYIDYCAGVNLSGLDEMGVTSGKSLAYPRPEVLFSTWNDWREDPSLANPYCIGDNHWAVLLKKEDLDPTDGYHEYRFDWYPERVCFFIDGVLCKTIEKAVPQPPLSVMANIWANPGWKETDYPPAGDARMRIRDVTYIPFDTTCEPEKPPPQRPVAGSGADLSSILITTTKTPGVFPAGGAVGTAYVVLLVDTSGSMSDEMKLDEAKKRGIDFVKHAGATERIALMTFATGTSLVAGFGAARDGIIAALGGLVPNGNTALFDAVLDAVALLEGAPGGGRKVIRIVTDGLDNASRGTLEGLKFRLIKSGVEVVTVPVGSAQEGLNYLRAISEGTGPVRR